MSTRVSSVSARPGGVDAPLGPLSRWPQTTPVGALAPLARPSARRVRAPPRPAWPRPHRRAASAWRVSVSLRWAACSGRRRRERERRDDRSGSRLGRHYLNGPGVEAGDELGLPGPVVAEIQLALIGIRRSRISAHFMCVKRNIAAAVWLEPHELSCVTASEDAAVVHPNTWTGERRVARDDAAPTVRVTDPEVALLIACELAVRRVATVPALD